MAASVQLSSERGRNRLRRNDPLAIVGYATIRSKDDIRDAMDCLKSNTHVRSLSFHLAGIAPHKWMQVLANKTLNSLPQLEELHFYASTSTTHHRGIIIPENEKNQKNGPLDFLVYLKTHRMKRLTLHANLIDVSSAVIFLSRNLPLLTHVSLSIQPTVAPLLEALRRQTHHLGNRGVQSLQITGCCLEEKDMGQLIWMLQEKNLKELDLDTVTVREEDAKSLLENIREMKGSCLERLKVKRCSALLHKHLLEQPLDLQSLEYQPNRASSMFRLDPLFLHIREVHVEGSFCLMDDECMKILAQVLNDDRTRLELLSLQLITASPIPLLHALICNGTRWGGSNTSTSLRELRVCWNLQHLMDSIAFMSIVSLQTLAVSWSGMAIDRSLEGLWIQTIQQNTMMESILWKGIPQRALGNRNKCLAKLVPNYQAPTSLFCRLLWKLLREQRDPTVAYRVLQQRLDILQQRLC